MMSVPRSYTFKKLNLKALNNFIFTCWMLRSAAAYRELLEVPLPDVVKLMAIISLLRLRIHNIGP